MRDFRAKIGLCEGFSGGTLRCRPCRRLAILHPACAFTPPDASASADDGARHRNQRNPDAAQAPLEFEVPACSAREPRSPPTAGYTRELFRERFAVDAQRIKTVRLGVSDFWFAQRNGRAATRAAFGIAPDRVVIVTVARITRRKGHPVTLAALSTLPKELRKRILWLVIGPDGERVTT